jgi:hypothetical protein
VNTKNIRGPVFFADLKFVFAKKNNIGTGIGKNAVLPVLSAGIFW